MESVDSMDLDIVSSSSPVRSKKTENGARKRSGTDSDFDMSADEVSSESSEEEFANSSIDDHTHPVPQGSSVDEHSVDADAMSPKPVVKREKKSGLIALGENTALKEGRLAQFPPNRLDLSVSQIRESIDSHLNRNAEASRILEIFRSQYLDLVSRYPDRLEILDNEVPNFLMYNLASAGVVDLSLFQTTSFAGLDKQKIMLHYERVKSVVLEILKEAGSDSTQGDSQTKALYAYVPWWT